MLRLVLFAAILTALTALKLAAQEAKFVAGYAPRSSGSVTFSRDVAPIIFKNCSGCHRDDQAAPFNLLTYGDVRRKAKTILDVVERRYMPPWPPEPGFGEFEDECRLTVDQIGLIQQWVREGFKEGRPEDLPPDPERNERWELGPPDLVVTIPETYTLAADGKDVYHNFVIPLSLAGNRFVRAIEFRPANKAVHHAGMYLDSTRQSRLLDLREPGAGFSGLALPVSASSPQGEFLSWQPGRRAYKSRDGFAWTLPKDADFVLQLHMKPSGKPEIIRPEVGFYFTDRAPARSFFKLVLTSTSLDIPAGEKNYLLEDSYRLPVDATVYGVNPHAHFLCREMRAQATLPDGTRKWLLLIKDWDFFWQGAYRLKTPMPLPKGTLLSIHFTYDNSADNPRNPNQPPRRVRYGGDSRDEMGEFWVQLLVSPTDYPKLYSDYQAKYETDTLNSLVRRLQVDPKDVTTQISMGKFMMSRGATNEAMPYFERAAELDPSLDEPHLFLGAIHLSRNRTASARTELEQAIKLNPKNYQAIDELRLLSSQPARKTEPKERSRRPTATNGFDSPSEIPAPDRPAIK